MLNWIPLCPSDSLPKVPVWQRKGPLCESDELVETSNPRVRLYYGIVVPPPGRICARSSEVAKPVLLLAVMRKL